MSNTVTVKPKSIYLVHAWTGGNGIEKNTEDIRQIVRSEMAYGNVVIAAPLYLPHVYDEATEREKAMSVCLQLLEMCDCVYVVGQYITAGMLTELAHAVKLGKPITQFGTATIKVASGK